MAEDINLPSGVLGDIRNRPDPAVSAGPERGKNARRMSPI